MKYCLIRLGKDSVEEIKKINSSRGVQKPKLNFTIRCKQVPKEVSSDTYCFVWLGSDNNKGVPTKWEQGLRAFGKIKEKTGGPSYNDEWIVKFNLDIVFRKSIKHHDFLANASEAYIDFSEIPVVGINTHSNQTIQFIKSEEKGQSVYALFHAIDIIERDFYGNMKFEHPELNLQPDDIANSYSELEEPIEEEPSEGPTSLMESPFNPSLINIENKLLNIDLIIKRLSQRVPEIDLYPDFQRKDDLWDDTKQSRLIESILIKFPLPAFYFDGSNKDKWLVVDGLQRLSSIRNFIINKTLKLRNLEFLTKLEGLSYDQLDRDLQRELEETQVVAFIIKPGTPDDVKFNIFKRINTGGLILEPQEIRHALYQGVPAKFVAELASREEFRIATNYSIKTNRMLDRDFATRFLAFYLMGYEDYSPDLDSFMNKAMSLIYDLSENEKRSCRRAFVESMKVNFEIFGKYTFRKIKVLEDRRRPINKALFDTFSVLIAKLENQDHQKLIKNKEVVISKLIEAITMDDQFFSAISTSTSEKGKVQYRFQKISELINEVKY